MAPLKHLSLRSFESIDLPKVLTLYRQVFGELAAEAFERRFVWSQIENLAPQAAPKWVLDAEGEIVGFLGTVPVPYRIGGEHVLTHSPCDYMVDPRFRFHGIKLMKRAFSECKVVVSLDDIEATIAVSRFLKAKEVGRALRYVKVLDARLLQRRFRGLSRVPTFAWRGARETLRLLDWPTRLRSSGDWVVPLVGAFDTRFDRLFERILLAEPRAASVARTHSYLNWRYGPNSPNPDRAVFVAGDGELEGYVVVALGRDRERTGFILELVTSPSAPREVLEGLVVRAVEDLRQKGAWLVRWHLLDAESQVLGKLLAQSGFKRRAATYQLLVKAEAGTLASKLDRARWHQQFGDAEASHGAVS